MNSISIDDVKHLASLSALTIDETQAEKMRQEISEIIGYFEQLNEVDTTGVEPTYQVGGLENVTRNDEVKDYGVTRDDLLKNAPDSDGSYLKVGRVL